MYLICAFPALTKIRHRRYAEGRCGELDCPRKVNRSVYYYCKPCSRRRDEAIRKRGGYKTIWWFDHEE